MLGMGAFRVSKPDPDTLVIRTPRFILILSVIVQLVVLAFLGYSLGLPSGLGNLATALRDVQFAAWFSLLFGLVIFGVLLYSLRVAIVGREFVFDRVQGVLRKNGKELVELTDIECLQISTYEAGEYDGEGDRDSYGLIVECRETAIKMAASYDFDRMLSLAKHIADFVSVPIYSDLTGGYVKT
jgi:hypothetical protein